MIFAVDEAFITGHNVKTSQTDSLCLTLVQPRETRPDVTENVDWDVKK